MQLRESLDRGSPPGPIVYLCGSSNHDAAATIRRRARALRQDDLPWRVLWIDDQVAPEDPDVRWLRLEGFAVDCAANGARGLAMARSGLYNRIILDLHLPDLPGLTVLARLRADGISIPVLVLTGFGDYESAMAAGALGATAFKSKPVFVDELAAALARLVEAPAVRLNRRDPLTLGAGLTGAADHALAELLVRLQVLTLLDEGGHSVSDSLTASGNATGVVAAALVSALADPALAVPCFLACVEGFRKANAAAEGSPLWRVARDAQELVLRALGDTAGVDGTIAAALADLKETVATGRRPTEAEIATRHNIDPAHLGRLLQMKTGLGFRQWRSGYVMKAGVRYLVEGDEQMKQIACRRLGFDHESQFDREFRNLFGLTPTEFRRLWRATRR
jgi:CheY-like chemotaxis protein/AraC-like DNA-binding protein